MTFKLPVFPSLTKEDFTNSYNCIGIKHCIGDFPFPAWIEMKRADDDWNSSNGWIIQGVVSATELFDDAIVTTDLLDIFDDVPNQVDVCKTYNLAVDQLRELYLDWIRNNMLVTRNIEGEEVHDEKEFNCR